MDEADVIRAHQEDGANAMETYLGTLARRLRLDPEDTRAVVAEVRGNLEDLAAHLRGQGYAHEEAEAEAVRRFEDAGGLARSIRRARRGAPLSLRALALLLVLAGLTGVVVGVDALSTATVSVFRHTDSLMIDYGRLQTIAGGLFGGGQGLGDVVGMLMVLALGPIILTGAALSLWLAGTVLFGTKRGRWRRVGLSTLGAMAIDGGIAIALLGTVSHAAPPPASIPSGTQLRMDGLSFQPTPDQPTSPVTVDRVYADRTATYVQYHIADAVRDGEPFPTLHDDRGRSYEFMSCDPCNGYGDNGRGRGIQQMMPWRTAQQGIAQFAPLRSDARAAVLLFSDYVNTPARETVQVSVDLRAWRRHTGDTRPFRVVNGHGVRINLTRVVRGVSSTVINFTVDAASTVAPAGSAVSEIHAALLDARGRPIDRLPSPYGNGCHGGRHCDPEWNMPALPHGARLTLDVESVVVYKQGGPVWPGHTVAGPWRIPFVMP